MDWDWAIACDHHGEGEEVCVEEDNMQVWNTLPTSQQ